MGYANVIERCGRDRKWHEVILQQNATMATESRQRVIAKFEAKGDAYVWAIEISKRFDSDKTLIVD